MLGFIHQHPVAQASPIHCQINLKPRKGSFWNRGQSLSLSWKKYLLLWWHGRKIDFGLSPVISHTS